MIYGAILSSWLNWYLLLVWKYLLPPVQDINRDIENNDFFIGTIIEKSDFNLPCLLWGNMKNSLSFCWYFPINSIMSGPKWELRYRLLIIFFLELKIEFVIWRNRVMSKKLPLEKNMICSKKWWSAALQFLRRLLLSSLPVSKI